MDSLDIDEARNVKNSHNDNGSSDATFYGRETEVNVLADAFHRTIGKNKVIHSNDNDSTMVQQELVFITGTSGSGKTALAQTLYPLVTSEMGLMVSGKFELRRGQDPYEVFASVTSQLVDMLVIKSDEEQANHHRPPHPQLEQIQQAIRGAIGSEGMLLLELIPSVERIIGPQEKTCDVSGVEALHQLQLVFCQFCRAIASVVPLVLFLDDLQWSDPASLDLLRCLLQPASIEYDKQALLIVGAYRVEDNNHDLNKQHSSSSSESSPPPNDFQQYLWRYWQGSTTNPTNLNVTTIHLENLTEMSLNEMVSGMLGVSAETAMNLSRRVHATCGGNVFHAIEFTRMLLDQGSPWHDKGGHHTDQTSLLWNAEAMDAIAYNNIESIDNLVQRKLLATLDPFAQQVLQVAACIGDEINQVALSTVLDGKTAEISDSLELARRASILDMDKRRRQYRFRHDRIRQATLALVPDEKKLCFDIGYKLWQRLPPLYFDSVMFTVTNLINHGVDLMTDKEDRYKAAALNRDAGRKAAALAAFPDAARFFAAGITFLGGCDYWKEDYQLSLALFNAAADAELCNQRFDRVMELVEEIYQHAHGTQDKLSAYAAQINAVGQRGNLTEAVEIGLGVLRKLGEDIPTRLTKYYLVSEVVQTKLVMHGRSHNDLLSLRPMTDVNKIAAVFVWNLLLPYSFQSGSPYIFLCGTRVVRLSLKYGVTKGCATGFVTYAWLTCQSNREKAYKIGKLALSIVEKMRARELLPRVHCSFYYFVHHWTRPLIESLEGLQYSAEVGFKNGDVEYALYCLAFRCWHLLYSGIPLAQVESSLTETLNHMRHYQQENSIHRLIVQMQYIHCLTGRDVNPKLLCAEFDTREPVGVKYNHFAFSADLAYMFGDFELAEQWTKQRLELNFELPSRFLHTLNTLRDALIAVAQARAGIGQRHRHIKTANKSLKWLRAWSRDCTENFLNKKLFLEAELKSLGQRKSFKKSIQEMYDSAIKEGLDQGFVHEAARTCERAGDYMDRHKDPKQAMTYWEKARELYLAWGAVTKADHMLQFVEKSKDDVPGNCLSEVPKPPSTSLLRS